jgi:hypothetical protein
MVWRVDLKTHVFDPYRVGGGGIEGWVLSWIGKRDELGEGRWLAIEAGAVGRPLWVGFSRIWNADLVARQNGGRVFWFRGVATAGSGLRR